MDEQPITQDMSFIQCEFAGKAEDLTSAIDEQPAAQVFSISPISNTYLYYRSSKGKFHTNSRFRIASEWLADLTPPQYPTRQYPVSSVVITSFDVKLGIEWEFSIPNLTLDGIVEAVAISGVDVMCPFEVGVDVIFLQ
ncbi:uncharacterized protein LOC130686493 [Daphnia carinata]|uniref:uncharacterized protein LOC130686493 n=1 Tax=Daphnia carinata TaxID=120202 RepID=UPI00257BF0C2|nr:uncharacterized protein LOC130686493 [Daphnia carinata]